MSFINYRNEVLYLLYLIFLLYYYNGSETLHFIIILKGIIQCPKKKKIQ